MKNWILFAVFIELFGCSSIRKQLQSEVITTGFTDANTQLVLPDSFGDERIPIPLYTMPRTPEGNYLLLPGFYSMMSESYCLQAGTYAPGSGDGYVYAPLKGKKQDIVQSLIRNREQHSEISQEEIQLLLWAVIAKTNFEDLPTDLQIVASRLLTPAQLLTWNDGAIGVLSQTVLDKAISALPSDVQRIISLENDLRQRLADFEGDYADIEDQAILNGQAPSSGSEIKPGRWITHPDGYYLRYIPIGYQQTKVQVYVPEDAVAPGGNSGARAGRLIFRQIEYDASDDVAVPANPGEQRLAQSNESGNNSTPCGPAEDNKCDCVAHPVTHIEQPDAHTCWSTSFMMAFGRPPVINDPAMLNDNGEILGELENLQRFAIDNDIVLMNQDLFTFSEEQFRELLREGLKDGPVWILGAYDTFSADGTISLTGHGFVIGGMRDDCETDELYLDIYDPAYPADEGGVYTESYGYQLMITEIHYLFKCKP